MSATAPQVVLRQHLIDPEICIRCNTCEESCPIDAITHDSRNYVVNPDICNQCMNCIAPCPTGAIDNWREVLRGEAWSPAQQLEWDVLPQQPALPDSAVRLTVPAALPEGAAPEASETLAGDNLPTRGSTVPPKSAAQPALRLHTPSNPIVATVAGNFRVTDASAESDTRHIVLDFGAIPFPVLEGQSIGIIPPGDDGHGQAHHARQYSIASPRDGERPGYNNLALTVKRVTVDHDGNAVRGVCSNYLCDLKKGDKVRVIGPFGASFLMPNDPGSNLLMICTGTGSAPMRAMTERRRRRRDLGEGGRLMLFFGSRTEAELPYFGPLMHLPKEFVDINLAFSRAAGKPKRYVQDLMRERAEAVSQLLADDNTCIYVCGLKGMEDGVLDALRDIAAGAGMDWDGLVERLRAEGRLHLETY